jgi:hypothetical protein
VPLERGPLTPRTVCGISSPFGLLFPTSGQVTYVLRTHSPLSQGLAAPTAFDLHVLSTPPAFILSQDQTLRQKLQGVHRHLLSRHPEILCRQPVFRPVARAVGWLAQAHRPSFCLPLVLLPITLQLLRCRAPATPGARADGLYHSPSRPVKRETKNRCELLPFASAHSGRSRSIVWFRPQLQRAKQPTASIIIET